MGDYVVGAVVPLGGQPTVKVADNRLQGINIRGKTYLQSRAIPDSVVCIACGMNVKAHQIDTHHLAHVGQRDGHPPKLAWHEPYSADSFQAIFAAEYETAFDILVERQRKYGPQNIRNLGLAGVFGRLADDKIERVRKALNGKFVEGRVVLDPIQDFDDESFDDALYDIANYALIMLVLRQGLWGAPLQEEIDGQAG